MNPVLAAAGNGDATVVWQQNTSSGERRLMASRRVAGGAWSDPVRVSGRLPGHPSYDVAMSARGTSVVWISATHRVRVSRYLTGVGWTSPRALNRNHTKPSSVSVAMDRRGDITVVWAQQATHYPRHVLVVPETVKAVRRAVGGGWGPRFTLSGKPSQHRVEVGPQVAMDGRGDTTVAWTRVFPSEDVDRNCSVVMVSRRRSGATRWPTATAMPRGNNSCSEEAQVAMNRRGDTVLTWEGFPYDIDNYSWAAVAVRPAGGGGWSVHTPPVMSNNYFGQYLAGSAIDEAGNVTVAWNERVSDPGVYHALAARRPAGGPWEDPIMISGADEGVATGVAMGGDGTTTLLWSHWHGVRNGYQDLQSVQRTPAGEWTQPQTVSTLPPWGGSKLAMDSAGNAVTVWVERDGKTSRVMVASNAAV